MWKKPSVPTAGFAFAWRPAGTPPPGSSRSAPGCVARKRKRKFPWPRRTGASLSCRTHKTTALPRRCSGSTSRPPISRQTREAPAGRIRPGSLLGRRRQGPELDGHPGVALSVLTDMADAGERQVGASHPPALAGRLPENILARLDGLTGVGIELDGHLGVSHLHGMRVHDVAPDQQAVLAGIEQVGRMARCVARRGHHAETIDDGIAGAVGLEALRLL